MKFSKIHWTSQEMVVNGHYYIYYKEVITEMVVPVYLYGQVHIIVLEYRCLNGNFNVLLVNNKQAQPRCNLV